MILLVLSMTVIFAGAFWLGYRQYLKIEHLNRSNITAALITCTIILTLLVIAQWYGLFPETVAAQITMGLYSIAAGYFFGNGTKLIRRKLKAGEVDYMQRSFWIDIAPNLIASLLVAYGIYRTGILTLGPFTGIGVTSGISLIGFGFLGWTIRVVPEFREEGILILDKFIEWENILAFEWRSEGVITVDYMSEEGDVCQFRTSVPLEERLVVERLLARRIREHEDERKKLVQERENV